MVVSFRGFWSLYASVYDTLLALRPYQLMLSDVARELESPGGAGERVLHVLDAGCGTGNLSHSLARRGHSVEAIDAAPGMLEKTRGKCPQVKARLSDLDARLDFADGTFDGVVCSNVLYSLPHPARSLAELQRVLRPGGRLVLTNARNNFSMGEILRSHWRLSNAAGRLELILRLPSLLLLIAFNLVLLAREQKSRFYFPEADELRALLESLGYVEVSVAPTYARQGWIAVAHRPAERR